MAVLGTNLRITLLISNIMCDVIEHWVILIIRLIKKIDLNFLQWLSSYYNDGEGYYEDMIVMMMMTNMVILVADIIIINITIIFIIIIIIIITIIIIIITMSSWLFWSSSLIESS